MMMEELQLLPPSPLGALQTSFRTAIGACVGGAALPFVHAPLQHWRPAEASQLLWAVAAVLLACLGALRARYTHQRKRRAALQYAALVLPLFFFSTLAGTMLSELATVTPLSANE